MKKRSIKVLSEFEYVLSRPEIYIGTTNVLEEQVPIIEGGKFSYVKKSVSAGMYKLMEEIIDNAIDACIRLHADHGKPGLVSVHLDADTNHITVSDNGDGFYDALGVNPATGVSNIRTAFEYLRSGTNLGEDEDDYVVGTNGVGATIVNMLSDYFRVESRNKSSHYESVWEQFVQVKESTKKGRYKNTGTTVEFCPRKSVFIDEISGVEGLPDWDPDIIYSKLCFSNKCVNVTGAKVKYKFTIKRGNDTTSMLISPHFEPEDSYVIDRPNIYCAIYPQSNRNGDLMVVNSTVCKGSPTYYVRDIIDKLLKIKPEDNYHYSVILVMGTPKPLTKFGDQNKNLYTIHRTRIGPWMEEKWGTGFHPNKVAASDKWKTFSEVVNQKISHRKLRSAKLKSELTVSDKYFPSTTKGDLFIVEGDSAQGSILQGRDPYRQSIFAIKGVIKNCATVADVTGSKELVELMGILGGDEDNVEFDRVIIATDADPDGNHITGLLMLFFYRWFKGVVKSGKLYKMYMPLYAIGEGNKAEYFYNSASFEAHTGKKSNVRYLKGLGSLSIADWDYIMGNDRGLAQVVSTDDFETETWLNMAFDKGKDAPKLRKKWLTGNFRHK